MRSMFIFFAALMTQALLERQVRQAIQKAKIPPLKLYPEDREAPHPTTSQILKSFDEVSAFTVSEKDQPF